ncbi:MAG: hypothetical protein ACRCWR_03200 [Saezia sp.]
MTITAPLNCTGFKKNSTDTNNNRTFILFSRLIRLVLFFAYATLPMWATWLISQTGYRDIDPNDMLIAMGWLPISAAIITLSFMKFGWKEKCKGITCFIFYNAVALGGISYFIGF